MRRGDLKVIRIGRRVLVPEAEVERLRREGLRFSSRVQKPK
jgi:hypothetical protein